MDSSPTSSSLASGCVAILVAAGRGSRAGAGEPKQFRSLGGIPLLARTAKVFAGCPAVSRLVLVVPDPEDARIRLKPHLPGTPITFARGGATRQGSTAAGLEAAGDAELVLVHDGVRPFVGPELILRVIETAREVGAAVPVLPVRETLKKLDDRGGIAGTVRREEFALAQTPQGFRPEILKRALQWARENAWEGTDEAEIVEKSGLPVGRVEGSEGNLKITTRADFETARRILEAESGAGGIRVGIGYDVHPLVPGRPLILAGVRVPHSSGPAGHSDGDLICHAATDAILGAAGLPDIGQMFPDSDPALQGSDSLRLLSEAGRRVRDAGFQVINLDLVLVAEEPRIVPHLEAMRTNLARALGCLEPRLGIKGTRGEGLGFEGRREGMAAHAVALLGPGGGG